MLTTIAVLALAQSQTVSFTCRAETAPFLAQDLGKAIGRTLNVAKELENDVMVVSAQGTSTAKLLDEVARVDAAQWAKKGDGLELVPDRARRAQQKSDMEQERSHTYRKLMAQKRVDIAAQLAKPVKPDDPSQVPPSRLAYEAKLDLAFLDLLGGIDLANLPWDVRIAVTYSPTPNKMQLPLGPEADAAIAKIVAANNAFVSDPASRDDQDPDIESVPVRTISGYFKADLTVSYGGRHSIPDVGLMLFDRKGKVLLDESYKDTFDRLANDSDEVGGTKRDDKPIELDPATRALLQVESSLVGRRYVDTEFPGVLRPYLTGSPRHDPLSLLPSDELLALAKAREKPLVALVPDDAFPFLGAGETPMSLKTFESTLHTDIDPMIEIDRDGWMEVTPTDPYLARMFRLDRPALSEFLGASAAHGVPNLDDLAAFAARVPRIASASLGTYLRALVPEIRLMAYNRMNWLSLSLWGSLDAAQRQAVMDGSSIAVSSLPGNIVDDLAEAIYGHEASIAASRVTPADGSPEDDYRSEPTEALPNGLPSNATISIARRSAPSLSVPLFGSEPTNHTALAISEIANLAARHEIGYSGPDPYSLSAFRAMRLGTRTGLTLTFHLGEGINYVSQISDARFPDGGPRVSLASLPEELSASLQAAVEQSRTHYKAIKAAENQGEGAPPPR